MSATSVPKLPLIDHLAKPKHHSYSTHLILTACSIKNFSGIGSGTCVKLLKVIQDFFGGDQSIPCRSTVSTWSRKLASFCQDNISPDLDSQWVLLLDESITIGANKVLLLLGVPLSAFKFNRPLRFEDCHVLGAPLARSWTGEKVKEQISNLEQLGFIFDYAVSDQGVNLIKAAKLAGLERVNDCAHYFSTLLRRQYLKSPEFELFEKQCTLTKRAGTNCNHAHLLPPKHHANSRFMNITPVINWGNGMIALVEQHAEHELINPYLDKVNWVTEYKCLLNEMKSSVELVDQLSNALKKQGFHAGIYFWAKHLIADAHKVPITIRNGLQNYFDDLEIKRAHRSHLICSTDIVESHFAYLKRKPIHCVAAASRQLVICNRVVDYSQVKNAMEACTVLSLYEQAQKRGDPISVAQKRRIINKLIP